SGCCKHPACGKNRC
uniref:Alpha-conotoxin PIC n=1 Tax=Conus purpurascens TaxID=41690 RepID=CA1C_CONPU|nr:RecName: Full=Alpha-conotoxin PIC [Conus purpurascens]